MQSAMAKILDSVTLQEQEPTAHFFPSPRFDLPKLTIYPVCSGWWAGRGEYYQPR